MTELMNSQFAYGTEGSRCSCGRCDRVIPQRTMRVRIYRGGIDGKSFHLLCALVEVRATQIMLMEVLKHQGRTNREQWAI